jgi:hypothetical protein
MHPRHGMSIALEAAAQMGHGLDHRHPGTPAMSWDSADAMLLEVIAAFSTAIVNPLFWLLVLVATAGRRRVWAARIAAACVGASLGLLDVVLELTGRDRIAMLAGNLAAASLLGELVIHVVMPLWRFGLRCLDLVMALLRRVFSAGPD